MLGNLPVGLHALGIPGARRRPVPVVADPAHGGVAQALSGVYVRRSADAAVRVQAAQDVHMDRVASALADSAARIHARCSFNAIRAATAHAVAVADALMGVSVTHYLRASTTIGVNGFLIPFHEILDAGDNSAGASAKAQVQRVVGIAAIASAIVDAPSPRIHVSRSLDGSVHFSVDGARAGPTVESDGVRTAEMGADGVARVVSSNDFRATVHITSDAHAASVSVADAIATRLRTVLCGSHQVSAIPDMDVLRATVHASGRGHGGVNQDSATLSRFLYAQGRPANAGARQVYARLMKDAYARGDAAQGVQTNSVLLRNLVGFVAAAASAVSAEKAMFIYGLRQHAQGRMDVAAQALGAARRACAALARIGVGALAAMNPNPGAIEPDFRTLVVAPEGIMFEVPADDTTLWVHGDGFSMKTFTKQPEDILAYDVDFTQWFAGMDRDEVSSTTCEVDGAVGGDASGINVQRTAKLGDPAHVVKVWVAGGEDRVTYDIGLRIDTKNGLRKNVNFNIKVKEL